MAGLLYHTGRPIIHNYCDPVTAQAVFRYVQKTTSPHRKVPAGSSEPIIGKVLSTRHNLALLGAKWLIRPGTDVKLAGLGAKWFINQAQTSSIGAYTVLTQCAQVEFWQGVKYKAQFGFTRC